MKRNFKKGISMLVALAMTLTSASVVFADGELVTSVKYKDGFVTVTGTTDKANEAVDIFLLNPEKEKADLGAAKNTAAYKETVNFSDVIYSDAAKAYEITFGINGQDDNESYLLYVKSESGEEYERKISSNNIYVAVDGSDENGEGSQKKPFRTIAKAQEAARNALEGTATNVIIGAGEYVITEGLNFKAEDSGTAEAPVTYKAAEGAEVVVSGATQIPKEKISALTKADDADIIARLPESVANKVVKVDLSDIADEITGYASNWKAGKRIKPMGVYLNDDYQDISRWPNTGYTTIAANDITGSNNRNPEVDPGQYAKIIINNLDYSKLSSWDEPENVFIDGYIGNEWFVDSAKIAKKEDGSIDVTANGTIDDTTGAVIQLASYNTAYGVTAGGRVVLKNILEEIDSPGEWYVDVDAEKATMYYYPPHTLTEDDTLEITTLNSAMVTIEDTTNFAIEGITFEKNSNVDTDNNHGIKIKSGDNITIKDCTMKDIGAWGISHNKATNVTIDGCVMNNLGLGGISTTSGDEENLTSHNTVIKNCHISDIARDYQANDTAAVRVDGCGTVVKNNTFHNMKNSAIRYEGTYHLFEKNEIFNAVNDTSDAGAIYSGRSLVDYGSKILNNYLYHIGRNNQLSDNPIAGIFWDDNDSGETAIGNIIVTSGATGTARGIHIAGGADMVVTDNILVNASGVKGPQAITANRDYRTQIEGKKYMTDDDTKNMFITFKDAMDKSIIDTNNDDTVSVEELMAATEEAWKPGYKNAVFYNNVKSMFEAIKAGNYMKRNTYKDNFSYEANDDIEANMKVSGDGTYTQSVDVAESGFAKTNDYDYRLKDAQGTAAITDDTLLSTFGAQDYAIADEEKEFDLVFPAKKATVFDTSTYIKWEKVNVADEYIVKYSKNADLSNATTITTTDTMVELTELEENTTYYWSVEAVNLSFNIGGSLGTKTSEFKTATYEFTSPAYDATNKQITVDYVNVGADIEDVNFIAAVKVGGKLMSSAVDVQKVVKSDDGTITISASTLTNLGADAVLELYIWDKDMKSLTEKMLLDI